MTVFNCKGRHEKLVAIAVQVLQTTYDFVISRCCFAEDDKVMYKDSKCTCSLNKMFCLTTLSLYLDLFPTVE